MYDFYKNPPKTKEDLRDWLTSWLEPVETKTPFEKDGEQFVQEFGFNRAFYIHCVIRSISKNEYLWWVIPQERAGNFDTFPTKRFSSFDDLLSFVIDDYYKMWRLESFSTQQAADSSCATCL